MTAKQKQQITQQVIDRLQGREVAIKFVYDDECRFEECNGEPRPLTEEEYQTNSYQGCPKHWRAGSKVVRTRKNGVPVQGCAVCGNTQYETMPYAEYLEYYGNPGRHVYLGIIGEQRPLNCGCVDNENVPDDECECWDTIASVWGIDLMDDDPVLANLPIGIRMAVVDARALPGYLSELVEGLV